MEVTVAVTLVGTVLVKQETDEEEQVPEPDMPNVLFRPRLPGRSTNRGEREEQKMVSVEMATGMVAFPFAGKMQSARAQASRMSFTAHSRCCGRTCVPLASRPPRH